MNNEDGTVSTEKVRELVERMEAAGLTPSHLYVTPQDAGAGALVAAELGLVLHVDAQVPDGQIYLTPIAR